MNSPEKLIGHRFTELRSIGSTNELAREWTDQGLARHGEVIFAWEQTAGRGQRERAWLSEPGKNLAMTLLLENALLPDQTPFHLSVCSALACQSVLTGITRGDDAIKWPNDLYWKNRKLGGLLIETRKQWALVGIGINVNQTQFDPALPNPVSLRAITGKESDPKQLALQIAAAMNGQLSTWSEAGFEPLLTKYRSALFGKGESFTIKENGQKKRLKIIDVDDQGGLILEENGQKRTVFSGLEWIVED